MRGYRIVAGSCFLPASLSDRNTGRHALISTISTPPTPSCLTAMRLTCRSWCSDLPLPVSMSDTDAGKWGLIPIDVCRSAHPFHEYLSDGSASYLVVILLYDQRTPLTFSCLTVTRLLWERSCDPIHTFTFLCLTGIRETALIDDTDLRSPLHASLPDRATAHRS